MARSMVQPSDFPLELLHNDPSIIFALDEDLRLTYCNPAWDYFAARNGGESLRTPGPLGRSVLDFISGTLRDYYESTYRGVLKTGLPWEHSYECSSDSVFRKFFMHVLPMRSAGLLVVNSLRVEHPWEIPSCRALDQVYRNPNGLIVMCSHCRRTQRVARPPDIWDWVADYVKNQPTRVSHGLCKPCLEYYYRAE